jgi:hypothetical protein
MFIAISNYPDPTARAGLKVFATKKLIDHFLGRLHSHSARFLLTQKFGTLEDAIESATKYITRSQYHLERFRPNRLNNSRIICNFCKKIGHTEDECRKKRYNSKQNQNNSFHNNLQQNNQCRDTGREQNFFKTIIFFETIIQIIRTRAEIDLITAVILPIKLIIIINLISLTIDIIIIHLITQMVYI